MLEQLDSYDWNEAFDLNRRTGRPEPTEGYTGSLAPFDREDVAEIIGLVEGENDGDNWVGVFQLHDGRYASLDAGCDYTG